MKPGDVPALSPLDARIPEWDKTVLEERVCPVCRTEGRRLCIRPDSLEVKHCLECGLLFVSPCPGEDELTRFYDNYHQRHYRHVHTPKDVLATPLDDFRLTELASMKDLAKARVLDVGFGQGLNLVRLRRLGADVHGIDLDPEAVKVARGQLGFENVQCASIDGLDEKDRFDAITLFDVIEHPLHPLDVLETATHLLEPEGLLAIWSPNGSFIPSEREPVQLRVDLEHMQYFTFRTCQYVAQRLSLDIVHLESLGFPWLEGVDRLPERLARPDSLKLRGKRFVKSLPGFQAARKMRLFLRSLRKADVRQGTYHLFCVFRRSA